MSSVDGVSVVSEGPTMRKYRYRTSFLLITASYTGLIGLITIIIAFSSPYWLSSHKYTYSSFVRLGKFHSYSYSLIIKFIYYFCFFFDKQDYGHFVLIIISEHILFENNVLFVKS